MNLDNGWEACYQAAVFELDDTKLRLRIGEARHAIAVRLSQAHAALGVKEQRDIANALEILKVLERILDRTPARASIDSQHAHHQNNHSEDGSPAE
jgi:hypothetical protein